MDPKDYGSPVRTRYGAQSSQVTELRQSVEETQRQVTRVSDRLELSPVDAQEFRSRPK